VQLIGANRAGRFFHLIPVFGAVMAIGFSANAASCSTWWFSALVLAGYYRRENSR